MILFWAAAFLVITEFSWSTTCLQTCDSQPLTLNTNAFKAVLFGFAPCPCSSCVKVNFTEFVTFYYSTDGMKYKTDSNEVQLNTDRRTLIIIHGYCDSVSLESPFWMVSLAKVMMLSAGYENVILIDYGPLCCNYYTMSGIIAPQMGEYIADAIISKGLKPNSIDVVSHSLGAHIGGYMGSTLIAKKHGSLNKIFALCKAAVNFDETNRGLNKTCASTVIDVISDNGNGFGSNELRGSVMYFLNLNSTIQPGCWTSNCNHQMCIQLFYASNVPKNFHNPEMLHGTSCMKTLSSCATNIESSKLNAMSGNETGCFCVNTPECISIDV